MKKITQKKTKKAVKKTSKKTQQISLGEKDSAIVIFNEGGFEAFIPDQEPLAPAYASTAVASLVMVALSDKVAFDFLKARFDGIVSGAVKPVPLHSKEKK